MSFCVAGGAKPSPDCLLRIVGLLIFEAFIETSFYEVVKVAFFFVKSSILIVPPQLLADERERLASTLLLKPSAVPLVGNLRLRILMECDWMLD